MENPANVPLTLEPLKVSCGTSKCDVDLHCYRPNKKLPADRAGTCRECGANPVDWARITKRDRLDRTYTFAALQTEFIRHDYFNKSFDEKALKVARDEGHAALKAKVRQRLIKSIGSEKQFRDGIQTPKAGHPIFFAQHATATCCRKCLAYWHGIPKGSALTEGELDYCENLINGYLDERKAELFGASAAQASPS